MPADHHDWTRNGPGRALLWWPLCSFASIAVFPQAGVALIVASGVGLLALGAATLGLSALRRRAAQIVARPVRLARELDPESGAAGAAGTEALGTVSLPRRRAA